MTTPKDPTLSSEVTRILHLARGQGYLPYPDLLASFVEAHLREYLRQVCVDAPHVYGRLNASGAALEGSGVSPKGVSPHLAELPSKW